ncbi:MAG: 50S ribosomal protein L4 [Ruminococcaceae bacterium]|nr:50S ribosomal protein L4 [Oscillospiraceae bacterium]
MPNVILYNMEGKELGNYELNDAVFGIEPNETAVHTVVVAQLANQRQGTQSALTRAEVRGGGAKPWRQKGTGRARQGSTRSPQWTGGGVVFAPKPRSYAMSVNKKVRALAMKSALSAKAAASEIKVLDEITVPEIKTKQIAAMLKNLNVSGKTLIVLPEKNDLVYASAKNIEGVKTSFIGMLNVYDLLNCSTVILAKGAADKLGEVYA